MNATAEKRLGWRSGVLWSLAIVVATFAEMNALTWWDMKETWTTQPCPAHPKGGVARFRGETKQGHDAYFWEFLWADEDGTVWDRIDHADTCTELGQWSKPIPGTKER